MSSALGALLRRIVREHRADVMVDAIALNVYFRFHRLWWDRFGFTCKRFRRRAVTLVSTTGLYEVGEAV